MTEQFITIDKKIMTIWTMKMGISRNLRGPRRFSRGVLPLIVKKNQFITYQSVLKLLQTCIGNRLNLHVSWPFTRFKHDNDAIGHRLQFSRTKYPSRWTTFVTNQIQASLVNRKHLNLKHWWLFYIINSLCLKQASNARFFMLFH